MYISNSYSNNFVAGTIFDDFIENSGNHVTLYASYGNDTIQGWGGGGYSSLNGDFGNDLIQNNGGYRVTTSGGFGNDTIYNWGFYDKVDGGSGNDSISNHPDSTNTSIVGGDGDDTIQNHSARDSTIDGGYGKDYISNEGVNVTISGGADDDTIQGWGGGGYSSLNGDSGNDSIQNNGGYKVTTSGGSGNDTIYNWGFYDKVDGGTGNDSISNHPDSTNTSIIGGDGNDIIYNNSARDSTIDGGYGEDYISNTGDNVMISGGADDDTIWNDVGGAPTAGKKVSINGGVGNDFISNDGDNSTILGGNDFDIIQNWGLNSKVDGGNGNDSIKNEGDNVTIDGGAGNDTLWNDVGGAPTAGKKVSINGGVGNDFISNDGDNSTVLGGNDSDTIQNWGLNSKVDGGAGNDSIYNEGNSVTISTGDGNDTITQQSRNNISMNLGAGNDYVFNGWGSTNITIDAGTGNDFLNNDGSKLSLSGGEGDDSISLYGGENITVSGGKGNDTIWNNTAKNVLYKYAKGDGNDYIQGFKENSTLSINAQTAPLSIKSGSDIILTVSGGQITLQGAGNLSTVNIIETPANIHNSDNNTIVTTTNASDTITNTGDKATIRGLKGNDSIDNKAQNVSIDAGEGNDKISNKAKNVTIAPQNGNDSINNEANNVTIAGGAGNDTLFNNGEKVTISGGSDNDVIENYTKSNNVSIAGEAGNDSIKNEANNVTILGGAGNDSISGKSTATSILGGDGNDLISVQSSYKNTIIGGSGSDTIKLDWSSNEALIKHSKGDGNDVIEGFNSTDTLQLGDGTQTYSRTDSGTDIIITDEGGEKITLKGAATLSSVHIGGVTTLKVDNTKNETLISGDRLNDSIKNNGYEVTISAVAGADTISNYASNVTISAGADADYIENNNANNTSISGGSGNDKISISNGEKNTINGGAGSDSISISSSNEAVIQYNSGDGSDYISGFNETSTLQIDDGKTIYFKSITGGDVIISVGKDEITLAGAATLSTLNIIGEEETIGANIVNNKNNTSIICTDANDTIKNTGKNVTILGNGGRDSISNHTSEVTILSGAGNDFVFNNRGDNSLVDGGDGDDTINNKATYATILGGSGNDSIYNGDYGNQLVLDGGAGNDKIKNTGSSNLVIGGEGNDTIDNSDNRDNKDVTINAGAGDDSINNDSPNILFQYNAGDGNDIIQGFNETSTLSIAGGLYSLQKSGNDVIVSVDDGKITLTGAAKLSTVNIIGVQDKPASNINTFANNVSITGGNANDTIRNHGQNVMILAYGGNDSIFNNDGENVTIDGGKGNNYIYNNAKNVIINSGTGNDSISNWSEKVTIKTGSGNDLIENIDNEISIEAGDGNDSITNGGYYYGGDTHFDGTNVTINGGKGDDFIRNSWDYLLYRVDSKPINVLFTYDSGDGNDVIYGFNETSTLSISGDYYSSEKSGNDLILTVGDGKITLKGAAGLSTFNIIGEEKISALNIDNTENGTLITGTENNDTIKNNGEDVTIQAQDGNDTISNHYAQFVEIVAGAGNDSIFNNANFTTLDGGNGDDSITNANGYFSSISGAEGADLISITNSDDATLNGGAGDDSIKLDSGNNALIEYKAGDGNDLIEGFSKNSTLLIVDDYSTTKSGSDIIVTVGEDKITLKGAANLSNVNITDEYNEDDEEENDDDNSVNSTIEDSSATYKTYKPAVAIKSSYQYNKNYSVLNVSSALDNPVKITNGENSSIKANVAFGTAILTSENSGDKITFSENTSLNYGKIQADVFKGSVLSTNGAKEITFTNNSSAKITAPAGAKININSGTFIINDLPVKSDNGAGIITVEKDGMSFTGYGVQFVDLEVAKESYFGKLTPMTADYNFADKSYTIKNTAQVKTLSNDFTKITFDISADENASFKVNGKEFLVASDADNINVVEANRSTFKIQGKEIDAEKIGRVTIDEQITFSGTQIDFDGVKVNYALNKPVIYSLDGKEITISDAATLTTGDETKTFKCEAGSYVVNGRTFETSTDLTFSADANEIRIPLSDAATEIYFDGVQVSYVSDGGEIVFNGDKVTIPDGANLNITSPEEVKLNLAAGNFSIDYKDISIDNELEITVDKDNIKIPLSENPVTVNKAKITGNGEMTVDNTEAGFFSILLPDGALVENTSVNTFALKGKGTSASFGDENKKVQLTDDGTAYIEFDNEKGIGVGFNTLMFEHVEIEGVDAWTVETSGTHGIDKITGITNGATVSTSTKDIDAGDLRFEVETTGAGEFTICGQKFTSDTDTKNIYVVSYSPEGEIQVAPQGEEYKDDDSEAAGKVYEFKTAGDYTLNGITFHAAENTKAQTITRGVELDLSTGAFEYDGLTLSGGGTAQINRYNPSLISLTNGAKVSGSDATKYQNRQFEISGAVELIDKKFETDEQIRCALINVESSLDFEINGENISIPFTISGFVANDKYVQIQNDCYDGVKVVGKKISSIEGVKNSAHIIGNGLSDISIVTTSSGEFRIRNKDYTISNDSDGVTFVTDSHGNISEINGLAGSVEGNFENAISINGKAIRLTGASSIKVTSDGEKITEITNVAGDLVSADGKTYRKNVRVYELGGADKLLTSADGTIIFHGNKFETSAGKTFNLDEAGNISSIEKAQSETANVSANVLEEEPSTENFATITLSTTDNLEKVFGDFSEGVIVNGVFVKVTDSTNFIVKDDAQNVYIETTAPDTFTINGKTFTTSTDKTIFKLDASGNVSEIVTDSFYSDKAAYLIEGDFSDEIIFNGQKFCVTGTNDTSIFIGDETLISVNLARNNIKVVESGGASEIAVHGGGEITIGGKTFTTSNDFVGTLKTNSVENFVGTIEGELGGLDLSGITIDSEDKFSVTGDGEKVTAIENLQNGSLTGNLDAITINGAKISIDDSDEVTLTIADGKLKISGENNAEEITDMFTGDAAKIVAAGSRATVTNYDYKSGEAFRTEYENIADAIEENSIAYDDGKLNVNSSRVTFAEHADSRIINFVDTAGDLQKVGFASDDSKLDASKETGNLILVGGNNSTITGGKSQNQIYLEENGESTVILNGKNTIENFNEGFDGDKISISANCDFSFDGEKVKIKSGAARATLENISSDAARILTVINGKETKTAIAQEGAVIAAGDDTADAYYGKKSGVDFTGFEETLTVDLRENFSGINRVTVGGGQNTLISSSRNETLTSNGTTEFIFDKDSGRDVISNFKFDNDKISVGNETITAVNVNSSGGVRMEISGSAMLTLENAQGKNFQINNFVALVDENLTYNDAANYFVATSRNATLTVGEGAQIWLDGSHGKYFSGEIRTLDATTSTGKSELAGNDLDNRIFAGQGEASLWGGNGGDDLLVGGTGKNTFFYTNGNGNDTIVGANNGDVVNLSQVTLEQIASTNITADSVAINFKDGGSLQINSAADVTYQLTDGSKFSANHANLNWVS